MNFDDSFTVSSVMMLILTIPTLFMVREPKSKKQRQQEQAERSREAINADTE